MRGHAICKLAAIALFAACSATPAAASPILNWADRRDQDFTTRGFIASRTDPLIKDEQGRTVYDIDQNAFVDTATPSQINPSLLRQVKLFRKTGLFEVVDGVYQVRGFDVTNITFIRGHTGWVVIDPLLTPATARAAYQLVSEHLGHRPIKAVIYTHSHVDHFGGAAGIVSPQEVSFGRVAIIAPAGFLDATLKEFLINGNATQRRTDYAGIAVPHTADGNVGVGLAGGSAFGPISLIAPTVSVSRTGERRVIDGVELVFQMTPGTEAPAEMNIYLPQHRVLDMAENANVTMHNILSPRGVEVRDAKGWADDLTEAIRLFGAGTDVVMISHGWPRFGHDEALDYLSKQRDAYKFLHDQTVRMMNDGLLPAEIADRIRLPDALAREWYNHDYYGSLSFNARAVYQRYLGWYDGNPVHLQPLEPKDEAQRYVAAMGGRDSVLASARAAGSKGDEIWASDLLDRLVMADARDHEARTALADVYEQLARTQENGVWRNQYLSAALELRNGIAPRRMASLEESPILVGLPTAALFELMAVRLDPAKVGSAVLTLDFILTDRKERVRAAVRNDVLTYDMAPQGNEADAVVTLSRSQLIKLLLGATLDPAAGVTGSADSVKRFAGWFTAPASRFPIVWRP